MQFKDIVNRDLVNLTNCEHEPIHIPGSIQPHGFLLAIKTPGYTIDYCSGNCHEFIGVTYQQLLGKTINQVFGADETARFLQYVSGIRAAYVAPLSVEINTREFTCTVHTSHQYYILEFEPAASENLALSDIYLQTKQFTTYMQEATTLRSLCQAVANETRAITGYDRVMIYKFDAEYNGEVFAESCNNEVEPFLGLHYPHTDIPVQARELYIKNLLRLIADVNYTPVPIYTVDDNSNKYLDLGLSTLRSVSPIHIQYLQNMGVGATLTISLIYNQKLWGLIACHHYSPKYISIDTRIAAQLQGHFLTSQIPVREDVEEYAVGRKVNAALDELLDLVFSSDNLMLADLVKHPALLKITNAEGVIILVDGQLYHHGNVPGNNEIKRLITWLQVYSQPTGFATQKLIDVYADGMRCNAASGIIYHPLGSGAANCIIWCRPQALQQVNWAGDPQKAIIKNEKGLSPRKSFELWQEVKKCESLPWLNPELMAATNFTNALQKHVHMLFLSKEELKQRQLSHKLKEANDELENINWIGSHDLKEPLRKIQMFASRILSDDEGISDSIASSVKKMSDSANRMQSLIKDVLSYSKLSYIDEGFELVQLDDVVREVINELEFEIAEKNAMLTIEELPQIDGIPFLLHQLFVNLLRNALKFSNHGIPPVIKIQAHGVREENIGQQPGRFVKVSVCDNGIGFDNAYNETIFKVFTRLHKSHEQHGTGVGLALCRKIMQSHKGYILAQSTAGKGTCFNLYFPVS